MEGVRSLFATAPEPACNQRRAPTDLSASLVEISPFRSRRSVSASNSLSRSSWETLARETPASLASSARLFSPERKARHQARAVSSEAAPVHLAPPAALSAARWALPHPIVRSSPDRRRRRSGQESLSAGARAISDWCVMGVDRGAKARPHPPRGAGLFRGRGRGSVFTAHRGLPHQRGRMVRQRSPSSAASPRAPDSAAHSA